MFGEITAISFWKDAWPSDALLISLFPDFFYLIKGKDYSYCMIWLNQCRLIEINWTQQEPKRDQKDVNLTSKLMKERRVVDIVPQLSLNPSIQESMWGFVISMILCKGKFWRNPRKCVPKQDLIKMEWFGQGVENEGEASYACAIMHTVKHWPLEWSSTFISVPCFHVLTCIIHMLPFEGPQDPSLPPRLPPTKEVPEV